MKALYASIITVTYFQMVLIAQMIQLFLKIQQQFLFYGTCFDVSNIIISQ